MLQVLDEIPHLRSFVTSLYACEYGNFFRALADVEQTHILTSRALHQHARFYVREMRIIAYSQLLESYQSLSIDNMATAFGVSGDFIDSELSRFIASGRLPAVIDKVHGIVETRRPDHKNAQYTKIIKEGDVLLSKYELRVVACREKCTRLADITPVFRSRLVAKAFPYCVVELLGWVECDVFFARRL